MNKPAYLIYNVLNKTKETITNFWIPKFHTCRAAVRYMVRAHFSKMISFVFTFCEMKKKAQNKEKNPRE